MSASAPPDDEDDYGRSSAPVAPAVKPVVRPAAAGVPAQAAPVVERPGVARAPETGPEDLPEGADITSILGAFEKQQSDMPRLPPIERILRACGMPASDLQDTAEMILKLVANMRDSSRAEQQRVIETTMGSCTNILPNAPAAINKIALELIQTKKA